MKQSVWTNQSNPQAFITKGKQRIKQFEGQVYLANGDEYQIELFNPTPNHILAKIKLDNQFISGGGIVLRPGERIFLERFLDSNNKFVFKTYEVGKEAVQSGALSNNGYVEINFYNEIQNFANLNYNQPYGISGGYGVTNTFLYNSGTASFPTSTVTYSTNTGTLTSGISSVLTNTSNTFAGPNIRSSKIETGTTEKGGSSSQSFTNSHRNFSFSPFHNVAWQILPHSVKQWSSSDLPVTYCGECGSKRKKDSHKFCPNCGTKY
jgi:hypothetical protein